MRFGSICSGIEAATVASAHLGWEAAWLAEVDIPASEVLANRLSATAPVFQLDPDEPGISDKERKSRLSARKRAGKVAWGDRITNYGDFTKIADLIDRDKAEAPELLVGGTPCQAFSLAGRREGMSDPRGGLTLAFVDLFDAIDRRRERDGEEPAICMWENVPGVLSSKDNAFGCFLAALVGEDLPLQPSGKRWTDAGVVLGPERAVAWRIGNAEYFGLAQRRRRVIVVASARDGFDPAELLFEREGVRRDSAPSREDRKDVAGNLEARTTGGGFPGTDGACANPVGPVSELPGFRLTDTGYRDAVLCMGDAQANAAIHYNKSATLTYTHDGPPIIAFSCKDYGGDASESVSPTLRAMAHSGSHINGGGQVAVAISLRGREGGATAEVGDDVAGCLRASTGGGDKPYVMTNVVRRLMPVECERLQGFPDGWTDIGPDSQRYKQLGNSWAVNHISWVFNRIDQACRVEKTHQTLTAGNTEPLRVWLLAA